MQYLAENAHRPPKTVEGWYFYHKTKNYRVMARGFQAGAQYGAKLAALTLCFVCAEGLADIIREKADFWNSLLAGTACGAGFAAMGEFFIR